MKQMRGARRLLAMAWLLLPVSVIAGPTILNALSVNLTGTWALMVTDTGNGCMWKGPMFLTQTGMDFTGSCTLDLVTPSSGCPAMLSGNIAGSISGSGSGFAINFGLASGSFGTVSFTGIVSDDGQSASGSWENTDSGTWSAEKQAAQAAPALSGAGLALLFGLLLAAGVVRARRRAA